jgi:cytochrome c5
MAHASTPIPSTLRVAGASQLLRVGAPGRSRTYDPWLRRPILYPLSYGRVERITVNRYEKRYAVRGRKDTASIVLCRCFVALRPSVTKLGKGTGYNQKLPSTTLMAGMSSDHESPIKTPKQLAVAVTLALVVPIIAIVLLVSYVNSQKRLGSGTSTDKALATAALEKRISPIAQFELRDANAPRVLKTGEQVYNAQCTACHAAGAAGAPKFGDAASWASRIKTGYDALLNSSLKGKGAMAAQGGGDYSDEEIGRAVVYMANAAGAKFAEPTAAAKPAAAAAEVPANPAAPVAEKAMSAPTTVAAGVAAVAVAAVAPAANKGKELYNQACVACHAAGVAGSPKFGDKAAWGDRPKSGVDALTASVIKGKGAMPPKGGSAGTDAEIKLAVQYMLDELK